MMRKLLLVSCLSVLASVTSLAATITVSGVFPPTQSITTPQNPAPQFFVPVSIARFDPALGTLLSLTLSFTGNLSGAGTVTNNDPNSEVFMIFLAHDLLLTDPVSNVLAEIFPTFTSPSFTVAGNGGMGLGSGSGQDSATNTFSDFPTLNEFTGTGAIVTVVAGTDISGFTGGTNVAFSSTTNSSGLINVTYTYSPGIPMNTPEPATITIFGSGLVGLGLRKFARQNS